MDRRLAPLLLLPFALAACTDAVTTAPLAPRAPRADRLPAAGARALTVMTRNLYLGGDLFAVARPSPVPLPGRVAQVWMDIQSSNFPERAGAIAREIAETNPALVGLQEVPLYRYDPTGDAAFGGTHQATTVVLDFLSTLRDSLAARGLHYEVASSNLLSDIELPMFVSLNPVRLADIRYTDRDVILARADVPTRDPRSGVYAAKVPVNVSGVQIEVLRGWASVEATVGGIDLRFVDTHLETDGFPPIQVAQAQELLGILAAETKSTVLVCDCNSAADRSETASYGMLIDAGGFVDAWSEAHPHDPGYTSSLPESLFGEPTLHQRIDLILVRQGAHANAAAGILGGVHTDVVGEEYGDRTASGRWPSDHAGVVATMSWPKARAR